VMVHDWPVCKAVVQSSCSEKGAGTGDMPEMFKGAPPVFVSDVCFVSHAHQDLMPFEKKEQFRARVFETAPPSELPPCAFGTAD
jgi:hypothetical protein